MKKKFILFFLITFSFLLLSGCNSKKKKPNDTQTKQFAPIEVNVEGVDLKYVNGVSLSPEEDILYLSYTNLDEKVADETAKKLYKLTKSGNSYTNPEEIKLPDNLIVTSIFVGRDGKTVYFSAVSKDNMDTSNMYIGYNNFILFHQKIAKGTLSDGAVTDITYLEDLNTSQFQQPLSEDNDGNLLYLSGDEIFDISLCYAENNNGSYSTSHLIPESILMEAQYLLQQ